MNVLEHVVVSFAQKMWYHSHKRVGMLTKFIFQYVFNNQSFVK